jgi:endonuclease/exonuclease/phosphatase family metal-dependent hydrolase
MVCGAILLLEADMKLTLMSIGTFNLYNLNEPGMAIYTDPDGWTQAEYDRKIDWTQRTIRQLHPDIFGFQELWHAASIGRAIEASGLADEYDLLVPEDAAGTHIVCAAIVRRGLLLGEPEWIVQFPEKFILHSSGDDPQTPAIRVSIRSFSRPVLHFMVRPREDEEPVHVYVCHLKSKGPTQVYRERWFKEDETTYKKHQNNLGAAISTIRRTAEAAALRFMLTEQMKGTRTPVIVLGDINDSQTSNTANILTEQPRYLVGDSLGGGDVSLYTAQTLQEYRSTRDVYYTHIFQDMMESLDHILVSEEFYDNSRRRLWMFDGMTVNNDHLSFDDHKESGTNDHGIVRVVFKHRPIRTEAREIANASPR